MRGHWWRSRLAVAWLALPLLAAGPAPTLDHFASPDAAFSALVEAARGDDAAKLGRLLGPAGLDVVRSGDKVADQTAREHFVAAYDASHAIDAHGDTATLSVGADAWPFPIPLRHDAAGWSFDVAAGEDEILNRRIGANELYTQQVMLAYVDAQNEYAASLHDDGKLHVYAQHLVSRPGLHDGLYWPSADGEPESPFGPVFAEARASGYHPGETATPEPYHGYFFRILRGQGPHAPGGAYDYVVNGQMLGGFGLVAWPVRWGNSGVMTFVVNQDGEIYQKDLGPETASLAAAMKRFDPDPTWSKVGAPPPIPGEASEEAGGG